MLHRFFTWVIIFTLLPMLAVAQVPASGACTAEVVPPIAERYTKGLLFRIEKCGLPASFIVGTIHLDHPETFAIFNKLKTLMPKMQMAGFEYVTTEATQQKTTQMMFFPSLVKEDLSTLLSPAELKQIEDILVSKKGFPREAVRRLRPWAVTILLQFPEPVNDGIALDKRLQELAASMNVKLFSLESPEEQFKVFDGIPLKKQVLMIRDALKTRSQNDAFNAAMLKAYAEEDLVELHKISDQSFAMTSDQNLREYLEVYLLEKRNHVMATRLTPTLKNGESSLTAIGALHLMGKGGVLELLEKQGFRIYSVQ